MCDNKGAISLRKNANLNDLTRQVNVRKHFVKRSIDEKLIDVQFASSQSMIADSLTKAVTTNKIQKFVQDIGLVN